MDMKPMTETWDGYWRMNKFRADRILEGCTSNEEAAKCLAMGMTLNALSEEGK